jgi:HME family heavy-metal exporter
MRSLFMAAFGAALWGIALCGPAQAHEGHDHGEQAASAPPATLRAGRYRSAVLALIIMGSVPLALIGSVAALWLAGQPLSVASMIGFITLTGIAARNGILKISHYINLALHEDLPFGRDLILRGSLERLTPVLMTALSAGVALAPLLIDAATPGKEILHPVAVTIFGGLISATLLDSFLTPMLFLKFGRKPLERLRALSAGSEESARRDPARAEAQSF